MVAFLKFTLRHYLFWLLYFLVCQLVFLLFFINNEPTSLVITSVKVGLGLNLSTASYFTILAVLFGFVTAVLSKQAARVLKVLTFILLLASALVLLADLALFDNWGSRINGMAIWYLQFPEAMLNSTSVSTHWKFVIAGIAITWIFWYLYKKLNLYDLNAQTGKGSLSVVFIITTGILFIILRGGIGGRPIGKGAAYFSVHPALNYAAINGVWNFFDVVSHYKPQGNPYHFFDDSKINDLHKHYFVNQNDTLPRLSGVNQPNILFIYLESWTADVVGSIGGEQGVTPGFDALAKEGLLFSNFYSTGFRTEQGLMATLSGFPAQAQTYPMESLERFDNYPSLVRMLGNKGYYTNYITGGNPEFANTNAYLKASGINNVDGSLLARAKKRSAWGAMDEETFNYALQSYHNQKTPFFSMMVTLTSHEWFDAPVNQIFKDKDKVAAGYRNTVHYTDSCLHNFIEKAKKEPWYANTLIFVMADHACSYPLGRKINEPGRYRIPVLITGGALVNEWHGKKFESVTDHLSIPKLVCRETGLDVNQFHFTSNAIGGMAYYAYNNGFGVISDKGKMVYDLDLKNYVIRDSMDANQQSEMLHYGQFIMQVSAQLKNDLQTAKTF